MRRHEPIVHDSLLFPFLRQFIKAPIGRNFPGPGRSFYTSRAARKTALQFSNKEFF
jgi:hypothetical protein